MNVTGLRSAAANATIFIWLLAALAVGCAHPGVAALPGPSPSPSGGVSPSPGPTPSCGPQAAGAVDFVAMSVLATATTDPTYGLINGYAPVDPSSGQFSDVASIITVNPADRLQFENADEFSPAVILHSAVGLPTPLPTPGYVFPAAASSPVGSAISNSSLWSTGRVQPLCFSQSFSLTAGTYYFGDIDYYGSINMRDVLVVTTSVPPASARRFHRTFLRGPLVTGGVRVLDSARKKD
jgi:hypothetical protein